MQQKLKFSVDRCLLFIFQIDWGIEKFLNSNIAVHEAAIDAVSQVSRHLCLPDVIFFFRLIIVVVFIIYFFQNIVPNLDTFMLVVNLHIMFLQHSLDGLHVLVQLFEILGVTGLCLFQNLED